ncbi:MAG: arginase family protein [Halieaceae bacterium]|nr:arginase family protein [Halieaceae bacterium]
MPLDPEKLSQYQKAALKQLDENNDPRIAAFFKRCIEENNPVLAPALHTEDYFYRAPRTRDLVAVDIGCIGVPMDVSAPYRGGAKFGPRKIREWSKNHGPIHDRWNTIPFDLCSVADIGDVEFSRPHDTRQTVEDIFNKFCELYDADVNPLSIGGVHTISHPILKALGQKEPLGLIHIDAHADTMTGLMQGEELSDGAVFLNAVLDQGIDPERTIQIGIRGRATPFWQFSHDSGMRVITMDDFDELGLQKVLEEVRKIIGDGPCYISMDCDGIDSTYLPGTQLPEPFGLTSREVRSLIRGLRGLDIVGADIVELCPLVDVQDMSSNLTAALGFELLCLLAESRERRIGKSRKTYW